MMDLRMENMRLFYDYVIVVIVAMVLRFLFLLFL